MLVSHDTLISDHIGLILEKFRNGDNQAKLEAIQLLVSNFSFAVKDRLQFSACAI